MKLVSLAVLMLVIASVATSPGRAASPATKLQAQLRAQKAKVAKLQAQLTKTKKTDAASIAALKGEVGTLQGQLPPLNTQITNLTSANTTLTGQVATLTAQVGTLTTQVSQQAAGGAAAIVAASPADQWNAIVAIWQVFPQLAPTAFCGFDKTSTFFGGTGLNIADYTFSDNTNC